MIKIRIFAIIAIMLTLLNLSCSKEKIEQLAVENGLAIMTDGTWVITNYLEGNTNITALFTGWQCKFNTDKTAVATKGTNSIAGSWSASITNRTITSHFPPGSGILEKINGTWKTVKNNSTYGEFSQSINGIECVMELTKK